MGEEKDGWQAIACHHANRLIMCSLTSDEAIYVW